MSRARPRMVLIDISSPDDKPIRPPHLLEHMPGVGAERPDQIVELLRRRHGLGSVNDLVEGIAAVPRPDDVPRDERQDQSRRRPPYLLAPAPGVARAFASRCISTDTSG